MLIPKITNVVIHFHRRFKFKHILRPVVNCNLFYKGTNEWNFRNFNLSKNPDCARVHCDGFFIAYKHELNSPCIIDIFLIILNFHRCIIIILFFYSVFYLIRFSGYQKLYVYRYVIHTKQTE